MLNYNDLFTEVQNSKEEVYYTDGIVKDLYFASTERLERLNYNLNEKISTGAAPEEIELIKIEIEKENLKLDKLIEKFSIPNHAYMK